MPQASNDYGILTTRNIGGVALGKYRFDTWYGNGAYFSPQQLNHADLGFLGSLKGQKQLKHPPKETGFWLDELYVCEYCFKYTSNSDDMLLHRLVCSLRKRFPPIGKLVYRDLQSSYIIQKVRGFKHQLFCQNLSLFGKLFLDDKSVYYNLEYFDFYVLYGHDGDQSDHPSESTYKPMGFFSKEVISWDSSNNLACICVFPPYQRRRLGSLLIEFLYALAALTPGQARSGPEFPLSPFGKVTYLRFWSRKMAHVLHNHRHCKLITLTVLADATGFRKEDILLTLEHMKLVRHLDQTIDLMYGNLDQWCHQNNFDPVVDRQMLNPDCLFI